MHGSFLYAGAGTLLLGPTLPLFAAQWGLRDAQSGGLIAALFLGLFAGSISLSRNLRGNLICGAGLSTAGFLVLSFLFGYRLGFYPGMLTLFLTGVGLGQVTATINLLSALRYTDSQRRSSALSLLNFTWSAGAVLSPLIAAAFLRRNAVPELLRSYSGAGTVLLVTALLVLHSPRGEGQKADAPVARNGGMPLAALSFFMLMFFLYGGVEATVNGWLSTYTMRYSTLSAASAALISTFLWASFAGGRALCALLLLRGPETVIRAAGLLLSMMGVIALRQAVTGHAIALCASLIGLGISPFFAVTFSALVGRHPLPRQAGAATAMIGLGSAAFPYLLGLLSSGVGSLRSALLVPILIAGALLTLCLLPFGAPQRSVPTLPLDDARLAK